MNIGLALIDFATQVLLVLLGFALIFSPHVLSLEHPLGRRPDVEPVPPRDPGGDDRLHRDRDRLEPGRGGARPGQEHPAGDHVRGGRRLRHLLHAAVDRALRAAGHEDGRTATTRRCSGWARRTGFSNDPVLGLVENLGVHGAALSALKVYVGLLAATILFIATNAGVIGASRITYAMASYRQLPEVFRRLHKQFKTPYISLLVFAGVIPMIVLLPGKTSLPRDDVLVRRDALVHGRARLDRGAALQEPGRGADLPGAAEPAPARRGLAAVRHLRRARHGAVVARRGRTGGAHALGRSRLARGRLRHVRGLPAPGRARAVDRRPCARRS